MSSSRAKGLIWKEEIHGCVSTATFRLRFCMHCHFSVRLIHFNKFNLSFYVQSTCFLDTVATQGAVLY